MYIRYRYLPSYRALAKLTTSASEATTLPTLDVETGGDGPKPELTNLSPTGERRMTRSTVTVSRFIRGAQSD
jgi:hypothetical protein